MVGNSALPNVARIAVARLLPTGALDTSFGGNGTGKRTFTFGGSDDRATSVLYASSIGILVGGYSKVGNNNFAMANLTSTGALAFTFGGGSGIVTTDLGGDDRAIAVLVTISPSKHRRIYLVGSSTTAPSGLNDFAVARYLANGSLDTKFADQGKVRVDFGKDDLARAAAVDSHLVIAGISQPQGGGPRQMAVTRMGWDGKLDASFGINGKVMTTFDSSPYPEVTGVTIQKDGKAVVAGSATVSTSGTGQDWKLVRYLVR